MAFWFWGNPKKELDEIMAARSLILQPSICAGWALAVLLFATHWYVYDASRANANPVAYYLWWSAYMWVLLTPLAVWLATHYPLTTATWKWSLPFHLTSSLVLTVLQVFLEGSIGWFRHQHDLSFLGALRHYYSQHIQLSLVTYWVIVTATQFYRTHDLARQRSLRAAKLEAQLAESRLEILRAQLQPHFLFNTLQAATVLVHDDPSGAEDILLRLGELLRVSLDELRLPEITLSRELEILEQYMGIQQRRFGDRLRFELVTQDAVLSCRVPSMVLQPLVENAIRHGIGEHKDCDVVTITALEYGGRLLLNVSNRTGVLEDIPERLFKRGLGLINTKARLEQLYGDEQSLELRSLEPQGVAVVLTLPLRRVFAHAEPLAIGVAE